MANPRFKKRGQKKFAVQFRDVDQTKRQGWPYDGWMRCPCGYYHDQEDAEKAAKDMSATSSRWEFRATAISELPIGW